MDLRRLLRILSFVSFVFCSCLIHGQLSDVDSVLAIARAAVDSVRAEEARRSDDTVTLRLIPQTKRQEGYRNIDDQYLKEVEDMIKEREFQSSVSMIRNLYTQRSYNEETRFHKDGLASLASGLYSSWRGRHFRQSAGIFRHYDFNAVDYAPAVAPLALTWGLRAFGLKGRSSMKRLTLSNVMAMGMTVGISYAAKNIIDETRPDGYDNNSMPSMHSAVAFASATILHREYGHISPWFTVGGYSAALATQMLRVRHNRHWLSDTFIGASIGTVSTNLAYFITDKITRGKEVKGERLNQYELWRSYNFINHPSTVSIVSSVESGTTDIPDEAFTVVDGYDGDVSFSMRSMLSAGAEYNWFFNKWLAAEAMARVATCQVKVIPDGNSISSDDIYGMNLSFCHLNLGMKASTRMTPSLRLGFRMYGGMRMTGGADADFTDGSAAFVTLSSEACAEAGAGISLDFVRPANKCLLGFSCDYNHAFSALFTNRWVISSTWRVLL